MSAPREISTADLTRQLASLGAEPGGVLLVHASFRAVRPVEDGPPGLIRALRDALGPEGTLVMPSWTGSDDEPFDPRTTAAAPDLGVVADAFWRMPGVLRSDHPFAWAFGHRPCVCVRSGTRRGSKSGRTRSAASAPAARDAARWSASPTRGPRPP